MAVTEARAVWQRAANRFFVQEDAKRAPKLACCQSSSSTSRQVDVGPASESDGQDQPPVGFMPHNMNPTYSNLPPDTRWWLQLQPGYGYQKCLIYEHINASETEVVALKGDSTNSGGSNNIESSLNVHNRISTAGTMKDSVVRKEQLKAVYSKNVEMLEPMNVEETYELMEMDPDGCSIFKQFKEFFVDPEPPWIHGEKTVPWWLTTVKDELEYLPSNRDIDIPPTQKIHVRRQLNTPLGCFDKDEIFSLDRKPQTCSLSSPNADAPDHQESTHGREWVSAEGHTRYGPDKSFSCKTTSKNFTGSKAELLEALCHSQTRAREAEKAAKEACAKKEHIIKLFLRQASQLFAYKQWFQLLQLENLYFQIKTNDQPISSLFPVVVPWMPNKDQKPPLPRRRAKRKQHKHKRPGNEIRKYVVAIALGLSLVGAGLLVGWTVGWMLPL